MPSANFGSSQLTPFSRSSINLQNCTDPLGAPLVTFLCCKSRTFSPALVPVFKLTYGFFLLWEGQEQYSGRQQVNIPYSYCWTFGLKLVQQHSPPHLSHFTFKPTSLNFCNDISNISVSLTRGTHILHLFAYTQTSRTKYLLNEKSIYKYTSAVLARCCSPAFRTN